MRYKKCLFPRAQEGGKSDGSLATPLMSDLGSEVRREVNAGISTLSHLMERLETRDSNRTSGKFAPSNQHLIDTEGYSLL